jgi:LemA protein
MLNPSPQSSGVARGAIQKGCLIALGAVGLVVLLLGGTVVGKYNGLQDGKTRVEAQVSEIDNQYKRRNDLIPNLIETVKGVANFEQETLQAVVDARASVGSMKLSPDADPAQVEAFIKAQQGVGSAISRLLLVAENYPVLKATESFRDFQVQLEGTENRITTARRDYIDAIRGYNTTLRKFPGNVIGGLFNFEEFPQFAVEESTRELPKVDFSEE